MTVQRSDPRTTTIEVLDRVLDKGVVIDAQVRIAVVGLHVVDIDARIVVASIETYVKHGPAVANVDRRGRVPAAEPRPVPRRARPAPRRPRGTALYRCADGCAFRERRTAASIRKACPYREHTICTLVAD